MEQSWGRTKVAQITHASAEGCGLHSEYQTRTSQISLTQQKARGMLP